MILTAIAITAETIKLFTNGVLLGVTVYTAARTKRPNKRKKRNY